MVKALLSALVWSCLALLVMAQGAQATPYQEVPWTPHPLLRKEVKGRSLVKIQVMNLDLLEMELYPPTMGQEPTATKITTPMTKEGAMLMVNNGIGNYHWIAAHGEDDQGREYTLTTIHYFPMPGPSPTAMLALPKSRLEIIPQPLPREYATYRASEVWDFLVRFDAHPLPNLSITLYTPEHLEKKFLTDAHGVVHLLFPPFLEQPAIEKTQRRPVRPFQLAVDWIADTKRFTTVFQHEYAQAPLTNRHPALGWLVAGLGMAGGFSLWRSNKGEKK